MIVITLSNPAPSNRLPSVSPTPAKSVTGFSPIGSATKFLCFCDVLDIFIRFVLFSLSLQTIHKIRLWEFTRSSLNWNNITKYDESAAELYTFNVNGNEMTKFHRWCDAH